MRPDWTHQAGHQAHDKAQGGVHGQVWEHVQGVCQQWGEILKFKRKAAERKVK